MENGHAIKHWFFKSYLGVHKAKGDMKNRLEKFFSKTVKSGAIGTINEIYDGNLPHVPRGCISQAWSVAEPLRAYFEDIMEKRPKI